MTNQPFVCSFSSYFFVKLCTDLVSRKFFLLYSINDTIFSKVNLIKKKLQKFFLMNSLINRVPRFKSNFSSYIFLLKIGNSKISNNFMNYKLVSKKFFKLIYIITTFCEWECRNSFKNMLILFKNEIIFSKDIKILWKKLSQIFLFNIKKIFCFYNITSMYKNQNKTFFKLKTKIFCFSLLLLSNFSKWYYTRFIMFFANIFNQLQILDFLSTYVIFFEKKLQLKHIKHKLFILSLLSIYKCTTISSLLCFVLREITQENAFTDRLHNYRSFFFKKNCFHAVFLLWYDTKQ
mmetsp:Transcript_52164/g.136359  ORF Transcript_52164/g.136359 Transcript_52164/m.136359 type:complete len:291 (-) Transcript_52164:1109-1981(-)